MSGRGGSVPRGGGVSRGGVSGIGGGGGGRSDVGDDRGRDSQRGGLGGRGGRGNKGGRGHGKGRDPSLPMVFSDPKNPPAQNKEFIKLEGDMHKSLMMSDKKGKEMPISPGYGTEGKKEVLLYANYFPMKVDNNLLLHRYSIEILATPDPNNKGKILPEPVGKKVKRIIQLLITDCLKDYQTQIATDYKSNMVCKSKLPFQETGETEAVFTVTYRVDGEDMPLPGARSYSLKLTASSPVDVSEFLAFLNSTDANATFEHKEEVTQALNIVLGQYPKASDTIFSMGANKHWEIPELNTEKGMIANGNEAIRGIFISTRPAASGLFVNVNVKHVACYHSDSLPKVIGDFFDRYKKNHKWVEAEAYDALEKYLQNVRVYIKHIVRKNEAGEFIPNMKRISALARTTDGKLPDGSSAPHCPKVESDCGGLGDVKFYIGESEAGASASADSKKSTKVKLEKVENGYISVGEFFRQTYSAYCDKYLSEKGKKFGKDEYLPVINVGTKEKPIYLPAEVCDVVPGQFWGKKLDPSETKEMIKFAVRKPNQNADTIHKNAPKILGIQPTNKVLKEFGIKIAPKFLTVPGRVLEAPSVKYRNGTAQTGLGSWNMIKMQFSAGTTLDNWTYLWIEDKSYVPWSDEEDFDSTMHSFQKKMREVGIRCSDYSEGQHISVTAATAETEIKNALQNLDGTKGIPKPTLLVVVLPIENTAMYNKVKFMCDIEVGIHSVCVVAHKFACKMKSKNGVMFKDPNHQYFANVALKVNLKLGGTNQVLDSSKLCIISEGKTMVVGIDVTHPSPTSSSAAPSVASIVASTDKWLSQWPADICIQSNARDEMVSNLEAMMKSRLELWRNKQKVLPENLLIYRDGVSEGQYQIVLEKELKYINNACEEVYPAQDTKMGLPHITIIIVGKRHNTRFYPTATKDADDYSNPENGTVVDCGVTQTRNWDFFLQSHTALTGTARPAHYHVIYDEIFRNLQPKNTADKLEDLTHNMCYLFGRATKSVGICPAVYYTDLVCDRARRYLSRLFDPESDSSDSGKSKDTAAEQKKPDAAKGEEITVKDALKNTMFYI